jgi:hypothetical protein
MGRNIDEVIEKMKVEVPSGNDKFIKRLDWVKRDASYRPPESQHESWSFLFNEVFSYIEVLDEDWKVRVVSIFSTRPLETIKADEYLEQRKTYRR